MKPWIRRLLLLSSAFAALPAHSAEPVRVLHGEPLAGLHLARSAGASERLDFDAFGRRFELRLDANRRLLDAFGRRALRPGLEVYRGSVAGDPNSWLRIVIDHGRPAGIVFDGREFYAIEPPAGGGEPVIFRLADLYVEPGALTCASAATTGSAMLTRLGDEVAHAVAEANGAIAEIDMGILGDFEFASGNPVGAEAALVTRMNIVDGIFSEQLGVQLTLNTVEVFDAASDPFSDETDSGALLDELADYRGSTPAQQASGLTHLFTGRDLDGTTVGIAFTGALCHRRAGAGLTQSSASANFDALVAAHELGHNFGAPHDGESGSPCESTPENFLMAPRLNGSDTFSACSIDQMRDDIQRASCITALPATDVELTAVPPPGSVLLGDTATVVFDVDSRGTEPANDVTVAISVPAELGLESATASTGSCTTGAGSVDCTLGTLAAGSGSTVSIAVSADAVGTFDFDGTAAATGDAFAGNNAATLSLTVQLAVDLSVTVPGPVQIDEDESVTLRPVVANLGRDAVSDISVTVRPGGGLRIDSALLAGGDCTLAGGEAACTLTSLDSQASAELALGFTGIASGAQAYTVEIDSGTTDRDMANNAATGQVNVGNVPAGGPDDDSGGGSGGGLLLLALAVLAGRRVYSR